MNGIKSQRKTAGMLKSLWRDVALRLKPESLARSNGNSHRRAFVHLLNAIEAYAVPVERTKREQFCSTIRNLSDQFSHSASSDEALAIAGQVSATLKQYYERSSRVLSAQKEEYTQMVSMFTETLAAVDIHDGYSIKHLKGIEKQIQEATALEDVRTYRDLLGQCLHTIRDEILNQERASADLRLLLEQNFEAKEIFEDQDTIGDQSAIQTGCEKDPITGLPSRDQAESAILEATTGQNGYFVAPIVIRGLDSIYARLGDQVGDTVMLHATNKLLPSFREGDALFRWRGTSFVALLRRATTTTQVRSELSCLSALQIDDGIQVGTRLLWLPISISFHVFAATPPYYSLVLKIDQFIAAQAPAR